MVWPFRENRFRGTFLARLPCRCPSITAGLRRAEDRGRRDSPTASSGLTRRSSRGDLELSPARGRARPTTAWPRYWVYLNGELRNTGWWYYYLCTLLYKVPEGTWLLVVLLAGRARSSDRRTREPWADEICLWTVPVVVLFSMSFLTDINLGLRYVLSIFPYVFIAAGKVVPWVEGLGGLDDERIRRGRSWRRPSA